MARQPTSRDVAKLAGVSQTTVSYVMSGRRTVSPETEKRVQIAMKELGYQPHAGARSLRSRKSRVLGVVIPYHEGADGADQHYMLISLAQLLREHDFDLLLITANEGAAGLRRVMTTALCDGLFIMEVRFNDPRLEVVAESKIPTGPGPLSRRSSPLTWTITRPAPRPCTVFAMRGHAMLPSYIRPAQMCSP